MSLEALVFIAVIVISVVLHEVAHGVAANYLGDPTARLQGRLTLNPLAHIDPLGSVILPALLVFSGSSLLFGWAKPVPYNPYNLRNAKWGEAIVAIAGPASNLALAIVFALVVRFGAAAGMSAEMLSIGVTIVMVNVLLAIFNLIPVPPLDGSKILPTLLTPKLARSYEGFRSQLEANPFIGFGVVILFVLLFGDYFFAVVRAIASVLIG